VTGTGFTLGGITIMATVTTPMTTAELLAMPDDGVERWLIRGELREKPHHFHDRFHASTMTNVGSSLLNWRDRQAEPRGAAFSLVWIRLRRNPDTIVCTDLVYAAAGHLARQGDEPEFIDGAPVLAVEILSPRDREEEINETIDVYLDAGVALVWIIDPRDQTVTAYRPGAAPELFNVRQELSAEPHLPGFRVPVAELFE
jgi:Uma2 family endonuclease